jgi:hypothetical protein
MSSAMLDNILKTMPGHPKYLGGFGVELCTKGGFEGPAFGYAAESIMFVVIAEGKSFVYRIRSLAPPRGFVCI